MEKVSVRQRAEVVTIRQVSQRAEIRCVDRAFSPGGASAYTGPLHVTPNDETQELQTAFRKMPGNVVVDPVPDSYGHISWNGVSLRVY